MDPGQRPLAAGPGQRFWDLPSLVRVNSQNDDFGPPAVPGPPDGFPAAAGRSGPPDGFPASAGRLGRRLNFRCRAGSSGMLFPSYEFLMKIQILGLWLSWGLWIGSITYPFPIHYLFHFLFHYQFHYCNVFHITSLFCSVLN